MSDFCQMYDGNLKNWQTHAYVQKCLFFHFSLVIWLKYGNKKYIYLPYIPRVSNKLKNLNVQVIFKRGRTSGSILCNNKLKNTDGRRKNVVYRIQCECGKVYFGEIGQWFDARAQQHQTAINNLDMKNGIAAHISQTRSHDQMGRSKIYWPA